MVTAFAILAMFCFCCMIWSYIIIFSPPEHRKHHLNLKWGDLIFWFRHFSFRIKCHLIIYISLSPDSSDMITALRSDKTPYAMVSENPKRKMWRQNLYQNCIVAKKWDPGILDLGPFSAQIRKEKSTVLGCHWREGQAMCKLQGVKITGNQTGSTK